MEWDIIYISLEKAGAVPVVWSGTVPRVHEGTPANAVWAYNGVGSRGRGGSIWKY